MISECLYPFCILGVIVLVGLALAVFIILMRRGYFQPVRQGLHRAKTVVTRKARQTFYGGRFDGLAHTKYAYDVTRKYFLLIIILIHNLPDCH